MLLLLHLVELDQSYWAELKGVTLAAERDNPLSVSFDPYGRESNEICVTSYVLSHNLQVQDPSVPPIVFEELAIALKTEDPSFDVVEALNHPHWKLKIEASLDPETFAKRLTSSWRAVRKTMSHGTNHAVMALGGRKDSPGNPGAPLQEGGWGVDVVETTDPDAFLIAINWSGLISGRPVDGVVQVIDQ